MLKNASSELAAEFIVALILPHLVAIFLRVKAAASTGMVKDDLENSEGGGSVHLADISAGGVLPLDAVGQRH